MRRKHKKIKPACLICKHAEIDAPTLTFECANPKSKCHEMNVASNHVCKRYKANKEFLREVSTYENNKN